MPHDDDTLGTSEEENIVPNPTSFWENDNEIVIDENGKVLVCKGCPCPVLVSVFYEDCITGADIFVDPAILSFPFSPSISVGSVCYELVGASDVAIDTFAIQGEATDCDCDGEIWKRCSDSVEIVRTAVDFITEDFGWIIEGSTYVKAFKDVPGGPIDGAPCFVVDQSTPAANCAAICETDFTDTFPGTSLDVCRWADIGDPGGIVTVGNGNVNFDVTDNTLAVAAQISNRFPDFTGDFNINCDWLIVTWSNSGTNLSSANLSVTIGGTEYIVDRQHSTSGVDRITATGCGSAAIQNNTSTSGTFEISRVGSTVTLKVNGITLKTCTDSGTVEASFIFISVPAGSTGTTERDTNLYTLSKSCP